MRLWPDALAQPSKKNAQRQKYIRVLILTLVALSGVVFLTTKLYEPLVVSIPSAISHFNSSDTGPAREGERRDSFSLRLHPDDHVNRETAIIRLEWNITKSQRRPDGVAKDVYVVNGEFPNPIIECRSGDEVIVTIRNHLPDEEGTSIHWHGLRVANQMDGAVGLTQSVVAAGHEFVYSLSIPDDQSGTFWWHSHSESQRADGLYGAFVVHKPKTISGGLVAVQQHDVDEEQVLLVGDWYHRSGQKVLEAYKDWRNFKIEPAPDSLLLNGRGFFNCSMALKARPVDCTSDHDTDMFLIKPRTRIRVINTGALTGFSLAVTGYVMTLIEVDGGHRVAEMTADSIGVLYPGERMDIILEQKMANMAAPASLRISLDHENMRFPNLALTPVQEFAIVSRDTPGPARMLDGRLRPALSGAERSVLNLADVKGVKLHTESLSETANRTILLYTTISYLTEFEYRPKGFVNRTSWSSWDSSAVPLNSIGRDQWPTEAAQLVPTATTGEWVDVVVNNLDDKGHPFHLHGHDVFVLAVHRPTRVGASEAYNPFDGTRQPVGGSMNILYPVVKDTVYIPSRGYAVLRFKAESAGLWAFHCHVIWHQAVGMMMAFEIAAPS